MGFESGPLFALNLDTGEFVNYLLALTVILFSQFTLAQNPGTQDVYFDEATGTSSETVNGFAERYNREISGQQNAPTPVRPLERLDNKMELGPDGQMQQRGTAAQQRAYAERLIASCDAAVLAAQEKCQPSREISMIIQLIAQGVQQNNSQQACGNAAKLNGLSGAASAYFAQKCRGPANDCERTCKLAVGATEGSYQDEYNQCKFFQGQVRDGFIAGAMSVYQGYLAKKCQDKLDDQSCGNYEKISANPLCPGFCNYAKNWEHEQCKLDCKNPTLAQTNNCLCKLAENKNKPECRVITPNIPNFTTPTSTASVTTPTIPGNTANPNKLTAPEDDDDEALGNGYMPTGQPGGKPVTVAGSGGGGGGGPSALGGGSSLGGQGGSGAGPGPYNTDIEKGTSNAAGGGSQGGGPGGYGGGGANPFNGRGGGYGTKDDKFNWKAFLPKPEKNRAPAGVSSEMFNSGITAANGLTNFEKVNRKMKEKREYLIP